MSLRCAPPPLVPGQESRCAALGLDSRRSRRHSTGVLHGEELIHGTQHQQVKVENRVGIEAPPGAPRGGRAGPSLPALAGPAPGGPPTCRELRQSGHQRLRLRHGATRSGLYVGVLACTVAPRWYAPDALA